MPRRSDSTIPALRNWVRWWLTVEDAAAEGARCSGAGQTGGGHLGRAVPRLTPVGRRLLAEFVGTGLLVAVVGSGITAQQLSPNQIGLQLLENSTATVLGLAVLIATFGPLSGAHFNPVVSAVDWLQGRRHGTGLTGPHLLGYIGAQISGAVAGSILANAMFDTPAWQVSTHDRVTSGRLVGEVVATAGLIVVILALARTGRGSLSAAAVAAWIGAAYWFTSSTSFANPAVTIGRIFTNTFAVIAPESTPGFIAAQIGGAALGLGLVVVLYPSGAAGAANVVVPHNEPATPTPERTLPR